MKRIINGMRNLCIYLGFIFLIAAIGLQVVIRIISIDGMQQLSIGYFIISFTFFAVVIVYYLYKKQPSRKKR